MSPLGIKNLLLAGVANDGSSGKMALLSWAAHTFGVEPGNEKETLRFHVLGKKFKGWVIIEWREGADTYTVTFRSNQNYGYKVKGSYDGVMAEQLTALIDAFVEAVDAEIQVV